ncbi:hypothetical protein J6590_044420 [Homalodisca vitripennis]|nr:hypothetical protein J6590_044420 [Homalodisca vitripennis]
MSTKSYRKAPLKFVQVLCAQNYSSDAGRTFEGDMREDRGKHVCACSCIRTSWYESTFCIGVGLCEPWGEADKRPVAVVQSLRQWNVLCVHNPVFIGKFVKDKLQEKIDPSNESMESYGKN